MSRSSRGRAATISLAALAVALFSVCLAQNGTAFSGSDGPLPERYEEASDWVIDIHPRKLDNYLTYRGSPFKNLTLVEVAYKIRRSESGVWGDLTDYETLWFDGERPVGSHRHGALSLPENSPGIIRITDSDNSDSEVRALNSAALRTALNVHLVDAVTIAIMFPTSSWGKAAQDLSHFRFLPARKLAGFEKGQSIRLLSQPLSFDRYFYLNAKSAGAILE